MAAPKLRLDHVGFIVADLEASRLLAESLGFRLTSRSDLTQRLPDGRIVPSGGSQHSIMLEEGYIELQQITDPAAGHPLALAPLGGHRLHVLAFSTGDAESSNRACREHGLAAGPVLRWTREITEGALHGTARFAFFGLSDWKPADPAFLCWVEHGTPELVRQPGTANQPNGARGLVAVEFGGNAAACASWGATLKAAGAQPLARSGMFMTEGPLIRLNDASYPVCAPHAIELRCDSVQGIEDRAKAAGIPFRKSPGQISLDLKNQLGAEWRFREG